ncbi:MAG: hypothetical protein GY849_11765 [Deltaproteobacteria bacterium]|nr:hypothetical protein [Deltaproteobacteria bacterium]
MEKTKTSGPLFKGIDVFFLYLKISACTFPEARASGNTRNKETHLHAFHEP